MRHHRRNWCPDHGYWQDTDEAISCPAAGCDEVLRFGPLAPDRADPFGTPGTGNHAQVWAFEGGRIAVDRTLGGESRG